MIHLVTLEPHDPELIVAIGRFLFTAFGIGAELSKELALPAGASADGQLNAEKVVELTERPKIFADDKILYLVKRELQPRASPVGNIPTHGFADYGKERAIISAALVTEGLRDVEAQAPRLAKLAVHTVGHLFDLHHCIDHRCAMAPPWGEAFVAGQSIELCSFCRDKSERCMKNSAA